MRASEFITEGGPPRAKMHKDHENVAPGPGSYIARDTGGYDRVYHMNRMWMAMAMADGKSTKAVKMDAASPTEKFNGIHPYTDEEHRMVQAAMNTIPGEYHRLAKPTKSSEPSDIHKTSPILGFGGYEKKTKKKK
jgi:hypothetical protein